ncbi:MAG: complex I NDUFA9 subunit family protein [Pseudobdellovibrionaceae bacterium]
MRHGKIKESFTVTERFRDQIITILGGTGFLGRAITAKLAAEGARVKIVTRHPQCAYEVKALGSPAQITAVGCDYSSKEAIGKALAGSGAVINCTGILFEKGKHSRFSQLHKILPQKLGEIATEQGIPRIIHISALAVNYSAARYAISKFDGETALKKAFPAATIIRPSVIFGIGDNFTNKLARMIRTLPVFPLFGAGRSKFQPVHVEDVADAVLTCLITPQTRGKIYDATGPDTLTFAQIVAMVAQETGTAPCLIALPWWMGRLQASLFELASAIGILAAPPLTNDQITSLQHDNIADGKNETLQSLGITPTPLAATLPSYIIKAQS